MSWVFQFQYSCILDHMISHPNTQAGRKVNLENPTQPSAHNPFNKLASGFSHLTTNS